MKCLPHFEHYAIMDPHAAATAPMLYPNPSEAAVKLQYMGRSIVDVQAPAAIIDVAVVRRNCKLMLEAVDKLGVDFRAHVKTHKVRVEWLSYSRESSADGQISRPRRCRDSRLAKTPRR